MPQNCCVTHCSKKLHEEDGKKISFHKFPKEKASKDAWIKAIQRDVGRHFQITDNTRVCSRHFKNSDFNNTRAGRRKLRVATVPLIFSWKSASPVKRKPPKPRHIEVCTGNASREKDITLEEATSSAVVDEDRIIAHEEEITQLKLRNEELQENLRVEREKSLALKATVAYQNKQVENLKKQCQDHERKSFSLNRFNTDKDLNFYTGYPSIKVYDAFYDFCDPGNERENIHYWHSASTAFSGASSSAEDDNEGSECSPPKQGRPRALSPKDELFIILRRLRQGFAEKHLAHLYGVSQTTVSRIIIARINFLYLKLKISPCGHQESWSISICHSNLKKNFLQLGSLLIALK